MSCRHGRMVYDFKRTLASVPSTQSVGVYFQTTETQGGSIPKLKGKKGKNPEKKKS